MKVKRSMMLLLVVMSLFLITGCGSNMMEFAADDSSDEACQYEVTQNLNDGNWDDVTGESCATAMQKGAAYFGAAGYDIADIIARMNEANDSVSDNDTDTYLNDLVGIVTRSTLDNINNAILQYSLVPAGPNKADADFYRDVFLKPVKSLANLKMIMDSNGNGLDSSCDKNNNGKADEIDAASCAFEYAALASCADTDVTPTPPVAVTLPATYSGTYTGLEITITGAGADCASNKYYKLLYDTNSKVALTTSEDCTDGGKPWNCPYEENNAAVDSVAVLDQALTDADLALIGALGSTAEDAIEELRNDACGGDTCTSAEIAAYLLTL